MDCIEYYILIYLPEFTESGNIHLNIQIPQSFNLQSIWMKLMHFGSFPHRIVYYPTILGSRISTFYAAETKRVNSGLS